jgi:hypothetical protein
LRETDMSPTTDRRIAAYLAIPCVLLAGAGMSPPADAQSRWTIPATGQDRCYSITAEIACPPRGAPFHGQDPQHPGPGPDHVDHGDGTVTDRITGLMWTQALGEPLSWAQARAQASALRIGGHADWRLPSIKELFTLIDFRGHFAPTAAASTPFIDTRFFAFAYGTGRRFFDVQLWSDTPYVATTMNDDATVFGVNFADGRIKGYPRDRPGSGGREPQRMLARYVRGPASYGVNDLVDRGDGTVTDRGSGLTWQQIDDGTARTWAEALAYCSTLDLAGHTDWRLPNVKELHSIVDYTQAPAATQRPALAAPLSATQAESYFWSSTTVLDGPEDIKATRAAIIAFGRALGWMQMPPGSGTRRLIDVHGAGSQRTDLKAGDPARFPQGFGPQGDDVRIRNYARCVRGR